MDEGYTGDAAFSRPNDFDGNLAWARMKASERARHENINGKLKEFNILEHTFRNRLESHASYFRAVATLVQLGISWGNATYQIDYFIRR